MTKVLISGGAILWIILLLSVLALAVLLERVYKVVLFENNKASLRIKNFIREGNLEAATNYVASSKGYLSRALSTVLMNSEDSLEVIKEKVSRVIITTSMDLEKNLWFVRVVMNLAPVLGLLGTVTGMMKIFAGLSSTSINQAQFSAGLSEALVTTAAGLVALVPLSLIYGFIEKRMDRILLDMEASSLEVASIIKGDE